jgi:hypothetical protein
MQTITLSDAALALLELSAQRGDIAVDDSNRETCRELAAAAGNRCQFYFRQKKTELTPISFAPHASCHKDLLRVKKERCTLPLDAKDPLWPPR